MTTAIASSANFKSKRGEYTMAKLPANGNPDVGPFFYELFASAQMERERLNLPSRWNENHRLFRGQHWANVTTLKKASEHVTVNLFFANIMRTVANITAKEPQAEVVEVMGPDAPMVPGSSSRNDITKALSIKMRQWYSDTEQGNQLNRSAMNMEIYGSTIEKQIWNKANRRAETIVVDPYAFFPAPGTYDTPNDAPYVCHAYAMRIDEVERLFNATGVEVDDVYSLLGEEREDNRPIQSGTRTGSRNYPGNFSSVTHPSPRDPQFREQRALVVEIWTRDWSKNENGMLNYPGGVRVVTLTNRGQMVLRDRVNPNINWKLAEVNGIQGVQNCYLFDKFPFFKADSYEDTASFWGFSASEQTADLNLKIDELMTRISNYLGRLMLPTLIVPKDTGITLDMINNKAGLVLQPINHVAAQGIRYVSTPNLPSNFLEILNTYVTFFDRVSQIEDADRGSAPGQVIAASAIVALQERGAVLMRHKIRSIDYLVRERGRCALSFYQNFGLTKEYYEVDGEAVPVRGIELSQKDLNYVVESGSTVHRTTAQIQEQSEALYDKGVIDRQALLEVIQFPRWREIIQRVGEGQLGQALQILQQAGMEQEEAADIQQRLTEPQGRPGGNQGSGSPGAPAAPGVPKSQQGGNPPT